MRGKASGFIKDTKHVSVTMKVEIINLMTIVMSA